MTIGMISQRVSGFCNHLHELGIFVGIPADQKKCRSGMLLFQELDQIGSRIRMRSIVERQIQSLRTSYRIMRMASIQAAAGPRSLGQDQLSQGCEKIHLGKMQLIANASQGAVGHVLSLGEVDSDAAFISHDIGLWRLKANRPTVGSLFITPIEICFSACSFRQRGTQIRAACRFAIACG